MEERNISRVSVLSLICFIASSSPSCTPTFPKTGRIPTTKSDIFTDAKCSLAKSQLRPLVVEWSSADRAGLEASVSKSVLTVRYVGCSMEILQACSTDSKYSYVGTTHKQDRVSMKDADELYANIPLGAAKLEGTLKQAGELNVDMTIVGRRQLDMSTGRLKYEAFKGEDCAKATHYVSALTIGAFSFFAGADSEAGASASVLSVGIGGKTKGQKKLLNRDGDLAACEKSTHGADGPPDNCAAILRLDLAPIEGAPAAVTKSPPKSSTSAPDEFQAPPPKSKSIGPLAIGGFAVGAAGLLTGIITGIVATSKASSVKEQCPDKLCPPERESDLNSARTFGTISTIGLIVGGVGTGVGVLGLILHMNSSVDVKANVRSSAGLRVSPVVGISSLGLKGTF